MSTVKTIKISSVAASFVLCFGLSACNGQKVKQTFGIENTPPDEFRVMAQPSLEIPPSFALRPPEAKGVSLQTDNASKEARAALLASSSNEPRWIENDETYQPHPTPAVNADRALTSGEVALLKRTGAINVDGSIRQELIATEVAKVEEEEKTSQKGFFSKVLAKVSPNKEEAQPVLDASKEKARINETRQKGEKISGDEVAVLDKKDTGWIWNIFK